MLKNQKSRKKQLKYFRFSSIVLQMALIILAGAFLGDYLDSKKHTNTPVYTILLSLFSIALALYYVFKEIRKIDEKK